MSAIYNKKNLFKRIFSIALAVAIILSVPGMGTAASRTSLNRKKLTLKTGKTAVLNLKNNKKKTSWKIVSGKKRIKITVLSKNRIKVKGIKSGNAVVQVKAGKKKYRCKITVKASNKKTSSSSSSTSSKTTSSSSSSATPGQKPTQDEGAAYLDYTFQAVDGTSVSTRSDSGQATVLVFGRTDCGNCRSTVRSIAASQWVHRSDIRVIFADCNKSSSGAVKSFAAEYGCDDITFCYDEGYYISGAMWKYYHLFYDSNSFTFPVTVLIDGQNRIRHCMTSYQAADTIMDKMEAFVAGDPSATPSQKPADPSATPSQEPVQNGEFANLDYTFQAVDGTSVSTKSDAGQSTVIIFGKTSFESCQITMKDIAASQWVRRSDIRVIFAECDRASSEDVQSFAANYGCDDITFCYDEGYNIALAMWEYHDLFYGYSDTVTLPVTVLIDGENRIRHCMTSYQTADTIMDKMEKLVAAQPSTTQSSFKV